MLSSIRKYLHHRWNEAPDRWYPFLAVYYLTYACEFRCPYCSDGNRRPYYTLPDRTLSASEVITLLRAVRRHVDFLVLTGGEPLSHPGLREILDHLPRLRFNRVILTTNGFDLEAFLPSLGSAVTDLVVSLDTLDQAKADAWYGVGPGALDRILRNLDRAAAQRKRPREIIIASVVTPKNLDDLYAVCRYAWERGFTLAASPQLVGVKAEASLASDPRYRRFYDFLIAEKRRGRPVQGTIPYLEHMRDLPRFRCRPFTLLVLSPTGEVFYPCLEMGQPAGNLLVEEDLHRIRRAGLERFGPPPACDARCHSPCALGFSLIFSHPLSLLEEAYLQVKSRMRRLGRGA